MKKLLFGFKTTLVLMLIFILSAAVATFVESNYGALVARKFFYHSFWFEILLGLIAINITRSLFLYRSFSIRKISVPLFHLAFLLILAGAFFTHHWGIEGTVYIREGAKTNQVIVDETRSIDLPFEITLNDFVLDRYPGSHSPSSYSSYVRVTDSSKEQSFDYHIYMNHVLKYRGWRFFQTSYDNDEKGTILTASRDVLGTSLTYAGYLLAILLMVVSLFMPGSFFWEQLRKMKKITMLLILAIIPALGFSVDIDQSKVVGIDHASRFGALVVQDNRGRMKPMNTLNNEFMRKIYGKENFQGLTSDQVVLSMAVFPEYWSGVPIVAVKNKEVRTLIGSSGKYVSFSSLFDENREYRLMAPVDRVFMKPLAERSQTDKALVQLDEDANILHQFLTGHGYSIFPVKNAENNKWHTPADAAGFSPEKDDSIFLSNLFPLYVAEVGQAVASGDYANADRYLVAIDKYQKSVGATVFPSVGQLRAEHIYNRAEIFNWLTYLLFLAGLSLLILYFVTILKSKPFAVRVLNIYRIISAVALALLMGGIGLRWYIGGYIPVSNSFEVMIFLSVVVLFIGLLLSRRLPIVLALSLILSFAFLLVSAMNNGNPEIGTLVPVLKSYWLSIHVAVITSSYAFFALAMMLALVNLLAYSFIPAKKFSEYEERSQQLGVLIQILLIPGLYLLTTGTILGAVWANESWGRYWGWDPKETWALISIMVYALVGHLRLIPSMKEQLWKDIAAFWAFASVVMTFWGVNYLLSGLHSYGGTGQGRLPLSVIVILVALILFTAYSAFRYFRLKKKDTSNHYH